jgi:exodeoxyribonuclease V beta subunit
MLFDVLSRHLDVFEPHFLEASAGTGKTFAIEHLVVRLLIEGDTPFLIEQILVVTFTRAATRELKLRIRRSLVRAKEELENGCCSADYLKAIEEQGQRAVRAASDRIEAALICFDSAQIYTLHGFCHRILREFAFEAATCMEVSDPDERDYVALLEKMIKTHLKEEVSLPHYSPFQIKTLLKKHRAKPRKMVSSLANLIASGKQIASLPSYGELLEAFEREIRSLPPIDSAHFKSDLSLLTPQYKLMTGEEIPVQIALLAEILSSKACAPKQFDRLLCDDLFLEKMGDYNKKVRAKMPEPGALHYPDLIEQLRNALLSILEAARNPSHIFLRLAKDLQEKSRDLLESSETFSPDALLLRVEKALQVPRFVECVRGRFRAAIVDEFQDTDPVQWNIFEQLFLSHLRAICLVGDPK